MKLELLNNTVLCSWRIRHLPATGTTEMTLKASARSRTQYFPPAINLDSDEAELFIISINYGWAWPFPDCFAWVHPSTVGPQSTPCCCSQIAMPILVHTPGLPSESFQRGKGAGSEARKLSQWDQTTSDGVREDQQTTACVCFYK